MSDPRSEAVDILGGDYEARVLEPSPPSVTEFPFADDPVQPGEVPEGRLLVSPVPHHGDLTWDAIARDRPDIAEWCAERWLGAWRDLAPLPPAFAETRSVLHRVAEEVVAPGRKPDNEIALRWTRGGFGTPFFDEAGHDCQVRVEGAELVHLRGPEVTRGTIDGADPAAAAALGDFFGFAWSVLEHERAEQSDEDPSLVQLWPEHFDCAFDLGDESRGTKATLGASPGDEHHAEPYLYVLPWRKDVEGDAWNATGFTGAELGYSDIIASPDQRAAAIGFLHSRFEELGK